MNSCQEFERDFIPLLERELSTEEAESVREHLAGCAGCREKLARVETAFASLRDLPCPPVAEADVLAARARERWKARQRRANAVGYYWRPAFALGALLLAFFLVRHVMTGGKHVRIAKPLPPPRMQSAKPPAPRPVQIATAPHPRLGAPAPAPRVHPRVSRPVIVAGNRPRHNPRRAFARVHSRQTYAAAVTPHPGHPQTRETAIRALRQSRLSVNTRK